MNPRTLLLALCVSSPLAAQSAPAIGPAAEAVAAPHASLAQARWTDLTLVAPAAPGGGWDQTARVMQQVLRATGLAGNVQVVNAPGAAGTIGLARFVNADAGNPNTMLVMGLVMVSGIATNNSPVTLADATPIARLLGEHEVIVVPAASPFRTLGELIAAFKANPRAVSWGGGSAGGTDEILVRLVADAVGVPRDGVNYIAYSGGGQALASVLGGHVSAGVSGPGEFASQIESGQLRALGISAPERVASDSAIPTLREQGVDVTLLNWRGVMGPPGLSRGERVALQDLVRRLAATREWKEALARNGWTDITLVGEPFERFLRDETARVVPLVVASRGNGGRDWVAWFVLGGLGLSVAAAATQFKRPEGVNRASLTLVAVALTLNIAMMRPAGFMVASTVMFALVARAFGSARIVRDVVVGFALAGVIFFAFSRGLGVTLAAGPFG